MKTNIKHSLVAATAIVAFTILTGCSGGGGDSADSSSVTDAAGHILVASAIPNVAGTVLSCNRPSAAKVLGYPDSIPVTVADAPIKRMNISKDALNHQEQPNAQNTFMSMIAVVPSTSADGNLTDDGTTLLHPFIASYAEQVIGVYELGDGSADIGDPTHVDDIFVSLSLDGGQTWKKTNVSGTAMRGDQPNSSIKVNWTADKTATPNTDYPGHSHKPKMQINGNQVLVAWHDKFCPSGDPFGLYVKDEDGSATDVLVDANQPDYFKVNGSQGSINYELPCTIPDDPETKGTDESNCAPNGKEVYEVPFSCVWTARGVFNEDNNSMTWYKAEQLTSGSRDANKVWIATSQNSEDTSIGFALAWQEDPEGLRQGKGAGPGEGWSGATTNHGADIWYTYIAADKFEEIDLDAIVPEDALLDEEQATKPKAKNNFAYPVRITDNEVCIDGDTKLYCQVENLCTSYVVSKDSGEDGEDVVKSGKCVTNVLDPLWIEPTAVILDGDTGASRPAMTILKTDANESMVILAYEETKGLSESESGVPSNGEDDTDIAVEGKVVYFESFKFNQPIVVSPGNIVNPRAAEKDTGDSIFENARRAVIVNQEDACDGGDYTFGIMYKQGIETRGGSSDMFVRMNTGFTAKTFVSENNIPNLSSMPDFNKTLTPDDMPEDYWSSANLTDVTYVNTLENTFSPRGLMRGNDIFMGFEYTPNWSQTEQGNEPNTFYIHRFVNGAWEGPRQISKVIGKKVSTLDPRFITTSRGRFETTGLEVDKSNPDVLFLAYGTFDMQSGDELDLFYSRSTDRGLTWEHIINDANQTADAKIAGIKDLEEMEVQSFSSRDGTKLFNVWLQEEAVASYYDVPTETTLVDENGDVVDHFGGLDSWSARVDFNATAE